MYIYIYYIIYIYVYYIYIQTYFFLLFLKKRYFRINYISIHAYDRCPCARGTYQLVSKIDKKKWYKFRWMVIVIDYEYNLIKQILINN